MIFDFTIRQAKVNIKNIWTIDKKQWHDKLSFFLLSFIPSSSQPSGRLDFPSDIQGLDIYGSIYFKSPLITLAILFLMICYFRVQEEMEALRKNGQEYSHSVKYQWLHNRTGYGYHLEIITGSCCSFVCFEHHRLNIERLFINNVLVLWILT